MGNNQKGPSYKYLQSVDPKIYRELARRAKPLGISVQELVRVRVIPEFLFGAIPLNPRLIETLVEKGLIKNGSSRKLLGNGRLSKKA